MNNMLYFRGRSIYHISMTILASSSRRENSDINAIFKK
uniref:Uncharacterized protein n=1 Tax=Anguilla anguilla TaxID=7936 RepID=A0A0E9TLH4_ANGAN